jgi:ribosome biogenesis protein YTM1
VCAHPDSPFLVLSGSYDSTLRIWDVRSPRQALFSVVREPQPKEGAATKVKGVGDKVLCVDWDGERIVSGGEDGKLQVHKANV